MFRFVQLFVIAGLAAIATHALPQAPSSAQDELQAGEAALRAGNPDAAGTHFEAVLKLDPGNLEARAQLGAIAFAHGDCRSAESSFRAVLLQHPDLHKVEGLLAICEHRQGEPGAQNDLKNAFAKIADPRMRLDVGLELANSYYETGDLEHAVDVLQTLIAANPDNVELLFFAQRVYSELADGTLNKLAVLAPHSARMEELIAERLINQGELADAIQHYRAAIALSPTLPGAHFELAEALLQGNEQNPQAQQAALDELTKAVQTDGDSAKIECELGSIEMLQQKPQAAFASYKRAFALNPDNAQADAGVADGYRLEGNSAEAAKFYRLAIQNDPMDPEPHYKLALLDRNLHKPAEEKAEMKLFLDLRKTQDSVRALYREMNPRLAPAPALPPQANAAQPH